jgi:CelD/BcsL family acetyltransferase involved in cellulose biosynthesis
MQSHPGLQFDLIHFEKMPEAVGTQPNPFLSFSVTLNPSGAHLAQLTDDWETFYTAKRSATTRRRDRTKRKRLSEVGEVRFVTPDGADDIARTLDTLIDQKARSFTRMGVANMFARPGYPEFYRELATEPATRHLVHVSRLDVGSTAAAINLGAIFRDRYYHLLASYDDGDVSRFGPGVAHLHDLLRHAIERGCRIFDFTIGDERYKRDWCDTELKLYDLVSHTTWRGALVAMPVLAVRRLKRRIKQTPIFWDAFCRVRSMVGSFGWPKRQPTATPSP